MRVIPGTLLILIFLAAGGFGAICFIAGKSAIHEIEGLICVLIASVCVAAAYLGAPRRA